MNEQKLKDVVHEVLSEDYKSRNSDKWLILEVLRKMGFKIYIDYNELEDIPSFESITRCRRFIQNNLGECLPNQQVDEMRNRKQEENKLIWKNGGLAF